MFKWHLHKLVIQHIELPDNIILKTVPGNIFNIKEGSPNTGYNTLFFSFFPLGSVGYRDQILHESFNILMKIIYLFIYLFVWNLLAQMHLRIGNHKITV